MLPPVLLSLDRGHRVPSSAEGEAQIVLWLPQPQEEIIRFRPTGGGQSASVGFAELGSRPPRTVVSRRWGPDRSLVAQPQEEIIRFRPTGESESALADFAELADGHNSSLVQVVGFLGIHHSHWGKYLSQFAIKFGDRLGVHAL